MARADVGAQLRRRPLARVVETRSGAIPALAKRSSTSFSTPQVTGLTKPSGGGGA